MCRSVHVRLTPAERKAAGRWSGVLVPVYASAALFLFATVIFGTAPRQIDGVAVASSVATAADPARR